jgi:hypothetical protein
MNLLYTKKEVKKVIFKTSKKLVDNHTFYLENLKKAIFRVLNSYKSERYPTNYASLKFVFSWFGKPDE